MAKKKFVSGYGYGKGKKGSKKGGRRASSKQGARLSGS